MLHLFNGRAALMKAYKRLFADIDEEAGPLTFKRDPRASASASTHAMRASVTTTYNELVAAFGEPDFSDVDYADDDIKSVFQWDFSDSEGYVYTLYDWNLVTTREEAEKLRDSTSPSQWNIGGTSGASGLDLAEWIKQQLGAAHG